MKRLECLDGLRGLLAVYVVLGHMAPFSAFPGWITHSLSHGGSAVDVFFILSGLVITRSLESFRYQPRPFLIARTARIFPVYLLTFAVAVAVQPLPAAFTHMPWIPAASPARDMWSQGWPRTWSAEIIAHLSMTHGLPPQGMLPNAWVSFLGAAWSLSTEWQFYVLALLLSRSVAPLLCQPLARPRGDAGTRAPVMAALFLGLALAGVAWHGAMPESWQFSRAFLPNKAHYFALGIASAALVQRRDRAKGLYLLVLGSTMLVATLQGGVAKLTAPMVWSLCLAAQMRPDLPGLRLIAAGLRARPMLWLGAISYCLYLANEPIQKLVGVGLAHAARGDAWLFTVLWVPAAILLPLGAAAWLHRQIEAPALRWGRALAHTRTMSLAGAVEPGR